MTGLKSNPKRLPSRLFYDETGSALFERITESPEYYLTRIERAIFSQFAEEILEKAGRGLTLIELGAGTASKTELLIAALLRRQMSATFYPIDLSRTALQIAEDTLKGKFPGLTVRPLVGDYSTVLSNLKTVHGQKLVLYIGSSIGNYEPEQAIEVLSHIRRSLSPGDAVLLGTDMVKLKNVLRAAYNDPEGVTARFNLNILARINRELGGDFDLAAFRHVAVWNATQMRIEMHLESLRQQRVTIADLDTAFELRKGENIHTENSYKFTPEQVKQLLTSAGFELEAAWTDPQKWFAVNLARVR